MQTILGSLHGNRKMNETCGGRWLNAHEDRSANVKIFSGRCMVLCDVSNTGDYGLIIAEPKITSNDSNEVSAIDSTKNEVRVSGRLRVYRGAASLCSERPLQGPPSALLAFYTDDLEPRVPAVAVAIGTDILIYKNNKPFFKWSTPQIPCTPLEQDIWRQLVLPNNSGIDFLTENINSLKTIAFRELSPRSQNLLILASNQNENTEKGVGALENFIGRYIHAELPSRPSIITCLSSLNKNSQNVNAVACLVVATETGNIFILDPISFTVCHEASCTTTSGLAPTHIISSGMFDVDFRILIACRDSSLWLLRREWLEGRRLLQAPPGLPILECCILGPEQNIVLALTDRIMIWSRKGKPIYTIPISAKYSTISCLCLIQLPHLNTNLLAVGVNNQLQLYQNRILVDFIQLPDKPAAVKFGRLGQEENVLIIVTKDGSLLFKILKRTAEFSSSSIGVNDGTPNNAAITNKPLPLPKRSKLFAEQAQRERNHAQNIHQTFQQGLIRLRLTVAQNTALALNTTDQNVSDNTKFPIKLSAQVLGLGPKFTLTLTLENLSSDKSVCDLSVLLHANISKYNIYRPYLTVPMIAPEFSYKIETSVTELIDSTSFEEANDDHFIPIRVFVTVPTQTQPVLAATINMPPTDPLAFLI